MNRLPMNWLVAAACLLTLASCSTSPDASPWPGSPPSATQPSPFLFTVPYGPTAEDANESCDLGYVDASGRVVAKDFQYAQEFHDGYAGVVFPKERQHGVYTYVDSHFRVVRRVESWDHPRQLEGMVVVSALKDEGGSETLAGYVNLKTGEKLPPK